MEKVCQSTFKKSGRMRERGMDRSRMRKAWLQVMRSCDFPKASEKSGGGGGVRAMIAIVIIRLEKSKWIKWLRLLRQP